MQLGMIGLGKMGGNMVTRLLRGGHDIAVYDRNPDAIAGVVAAGARGTDSPHALVAALNAPRAIWVMVPAGDPTEQIITLLADAMEPGDVIIDGGNSNYRDSMRRATQLRERSLHYIDVGTSGGIWGLAEGYSMMIGGNEDVVAALAPIFATLAPAPEKGWGRVGPNGAGHFAKMVHNGIEYGLMQAYAEGFEPMEHKKELALDLHQIATIWQHGSVVRSWLLDLIVPVLAENPNLEGIAAYVADSGEGRWTVAEAIDLAVSMPVISLALQRRFRSRDPEPYSDKLLAALRNQFGGHSIKPTDS